MLARRDFLKRIGAGLPLLGVVLAGCEDSEKDIIPGADPNADFAIVYPREGKRVSGREVLKGVGARDVADMHVSVHTNQWWGQGGSLRVSGNNSWSYDAAFFGGFGEYNNHTIEAILTHTDGSVEKSYVRGLVRGPSKGSYSTI